MQKIIGLFLFIVVNTPNFGQNVTRKLENISFSKVTIEDAFWKPRMEKVADVTIPFAQDIITECGIEIEKIESAEK
jgi:hypothetical protein